MQPVYGQRGIALVMVLWLLVLLGVIATSHARNARIETRLAYNQSELVKARARAEAGVNRAILELLRSDADLPWPVDGSVMAFSFEGSTVQVAIRRTSGLVDLNSASSATLEKLLEGMGVEESLRLQLVDATLDWRDKDNLKHVNGAEDDDYRRAGMKWAARDGAFSSIEEFRYVMGMTNPLFEQLAPYLTIYSGQASVNLDFAPPWLLTILSNTEETSTPRNASTRAGSTFHITVWSTSNGGSHASIDLVVRMTPRSERAYKILSWRSPARSIAGTRG